MDAYLKIKVDGRAGKLAGDIPKRFYPGLFPAAEKLCIIQPKVDVLVQKVNLRSYIFWKYEFVVREQAELLFEEAGEKLFLFMNNGRTIPAQFPTQDRQFIPENHFNIHFTPEFKLRFFPDPSDRMYELLMIEIGSVDIDNPIEKLLGAYKVNPLAKN